MATALAGLWLAGCGGRPLPAPVGPRPDEPWPLAMRVLQKDPAGKLVVLGTVGPGVTEPPWPDGDRWFVEPQRLAALTADRLPALGRKLRQRRVPGLSLRDAAVVDDRTLLRLRPLPDLRPLDLT